MFPLLFLWWLQKKLYFYDCFVTLRRLIKNLQIKNNENLVIMVLHFQVVVKCADKQKEYEMITTKVRALFNVYDELKAYEWKL